jgi:serine/threonine-protein kinase RsbW
VSLILEIPVEERFVGLARHVAGQAARRVDLSDDQVEDVKVAVTELVSHAVDAQRKAGEESPIRVEIMIADPFEVTVVHAGAALDLTEGEEPWDEDGLGLMIARALVDSMGIEPLAGGGCRLMLSVTRQPEPTDAPPNERLRRPVDEP